jgi:hypothetical protein
MHTEPPSLERSLAVLLLGLLTAVLAGCTTVGSPPARPVEDGDVVAGGGIGALYPSHVRAQVGVGVEGGSVLAEVRTAGIQVEGSLARRFRLADREGAVPAVSVGLRAGGDVIAPSTAPPFTSTSALDDRASTRAVRGEWNGSLLWGGVVGRYALLANPAGWFSSLSLAALLESQRPTQVDLTCSVPDPRIGCEPSVPVRRLSGDREVRGRLFLGASLGYRFQLSLDTGLQVQVGGEMDPLYPLEGREFTDYGSIDAHPSWLVPATLHVGIQIDHLFSGSR